MFHLAIASPERFCTFDAEPQQRLAALTNRIQDGSVDPRHLLVVGDDLGQDVARVRIVVHADGSAVAQSWFASGEDADVARCYSILVDGLARAAAASGLPRIVTSVVDAWMPSPDALARCLADHGWRLDEERLELVATPRRSTPSDEIAGIDPHDPDVTAVMAAAMADSLDGYDREQVARHGPADAAVRYRDMMLEGLPHQPWLVHRDAERHIVDGIAAVANLGDEWDLAYLGVTPTARGRGVGRQLANAALSTAFGADATWVRASVAVENPPIRSVLTTTGFEVESRRSDFVLDLGG